MVIKKLKAVVTTEDEDGNVTTYTTEWEAKLPQVESINMRWERHVQRMLMEHPKDDFWADTGETITLTLRHPLKPI